MDYWFFFFWIAEYAYTLRVDEKSDVYSFGVVLLELITGRRPVGDYGDGVDLVQWCKKATNGRKEEVMNIVDMRLSVVAKEEAMHMLFIAMLCLQESSVVRPTMREVVQMLSEFPRPTASQHENNNKNSNNDNDDEDNNQTSSSYSNNIIPPSKSLKKQDPCPPTFKQDLLAWETWTFF